MAAARTGRPTTNLGAASSTLAAWAATPGWKRDRADLATTVPDRAIIALGTNDLASTSATYEANLTTLIAWLKGLGIPEIWVSTVPPYSGSPSEANRAAINAFLRGMPRGVARLVDFDVALRVQAAPTTADATFLTAYPHPLRAGYARMAVEV
jgi:lysophospholipase L1-like esterase